MKVKIRITKELFDLSVCGMSDQCIVANAIKLIAKEDIGISVEDDVYLFYDELEVTVRTSREVRNLITEFDGLEQARIRLASAHTYLSQINTEMKAIKEQDEKDLNRFFEKWIGKDIEVDIPENYLELTDMKDVESILVSHEIIEYERA